MAVFTRRDIQAAVDHVASSLTEEQTEGLVKRLNGTVAESLAAEWEVVVLSGLAKCGRIIYERSFGGKCCPDIFFQGQKPGSLEFAADVRAVSDADAHSKNPYNDFCDAIRRFLQKQGHISAGLHIDVGHIAEGAYGKRKLRLTMPQKEEMDSFVETELCHFLSGIARNCHEDDLLNYDKQGIRFSIHYNGKEKRFSGGSHVSYTVPYSTRNPLTNALIEKGAQLAKSGYQGPKGIIICDGGCDALKERSRGESAYGSQEIVERYIREHAYILWVLVLRVDEKHHTLSRETVISIAPKFFWNSKADRLLFPDTQAAIEQVVKYLPQPEATPTNAAHWLDGKNKEMGRPFGGYCIMRDKTIKISARALTELLAGRVDLQRFLEDHGFKPHPLQPTGFSFNFFDRQIAKGNTLQSASVERHDHEDDDWLLLKYDGPDPAISRFRSPSKDGSD